MVSVTVILVGLAATNMLVAVALLIAWARFGRDQHAALWAAGFLASAGGYLLQLVRAAVAPGSAVVPIAATDCLMASAALLALGFRLRAGRRGRAVLVIAAAVIAATVSAAGTLWLPELRLQRLLGNLFATAMLIVSAVAVRDTPAGLRSGNAAASWMLLGFAAYSAGLAGVAAATMGPLPAMDDTYRALYLAGVPTGMIAVGLGALLLLAGDLAERLHGLAEIDPLTGVLNRRGVDRAAARLLAQAQRTRRPLTVVVADLDRFKAINDSFGHAFGDAVLKRFAAYASQLVRAGDLVGRLGGEEFVFVLADTGIEQAGDAMNRLRAALSGAARDGVALTASFGIAGLSDRSDTLDAMVARADEALYRSKTEGRDRVSFAVPPGRQAATDARFRRTWRDRDRDRDHDAAADEAARSGAR